MAIFGILLFIIPAALGMVILYFIIKIAVSTAIRETLPHIMHGNKMWTNVIKEGVTAAGNEFLKQEIKKAIKEATREMNEENQPGEN